VTMPRRDFLKMLLSATGLLAATTLGGAAYSLFLEPYRIHISRLEITLPRLPQAFNGLTLVHISDLHFGGWMNATRMIGTAHLINTLQPDLIAITGDFVSRINPTVAAELTASLQVLDARYGVYGILGNHDHWTDTEMVSQAIRSAGIQLLVNESSVIERNGQRLTIAGLDDIWENRQELDAALHGVPQDSCVIILVHEPDYAKTVAEDGRVDLQLSGHTHGGQIRLPLIGSPVLPILGKNYDQGLFTIQNMQLYVNRGLGMLDPPVRFRCSPEITHITLRTPTQSS
jgi:uncharacterized protein